MTQPVASSVGSAALLRMRGISKRFPGVQALDAVDLEVRAGEVHALVGENGAGKSTLMHILSGVYRPDEGEIDFDGARTLNISDEETARQLGIAIVFQERSLFGPLSIAENIFAGRQPAGRIGWIRRREMYGEAATLLRRVDVCTDPGTAVEQLSPHHQQLVEVAKALSIRAKLVIFDEPTAALTETETEALFRVIKKLQADGVGVIYISHRLEEIFHLADRVTVLKDGKRQGTVGASESSPDQLVTMMVGRELGQTSFHASTPPVGQSPALEVRGLSDAARTTGSGGRLDQVSFSAWSGEIVALAGLAGAGRSETALCVFGARRFARGQILVDGEPIRLRSVADAMRAGIGYLPEDRKDGGLFLEMSITANMAAAKLDRYGPTWTSDAQMRAEARSHVGKLQIAARDIGQNVVHLSGGNQQKVLLARWLLVDPKILIVDEPTRGVDVGAKAEMHRLLRELAEQGTAVVVISSELPEILSIADRIIVLAEGRISGELSRDDVTEEKIVHLASMTTSEPTAA